VKQDIKAQMDRGANIDDIAELAELEMRRWKSVGAAISGPTALIGGIEGIESNTVMPDGDIASGSITATETALWPAATYSPLAANMQVPKAFKVIAFGQQTTAATPGTMTFTPRIGTTNGGSTLGASTATAQTASETTTDWMLEGALIIRAIGAAGASNAAAKGMFHYYQGTATTSGSIVLPAMHQIFGGTTATWDGTTTSALWMGLTAATSTTNTFTTMGVVFASFN
jgi:hypothetical protein